MLRPLPLLGGNECAGALCLARLICQDWGSARERRICMRSHTRVSAQTRARAQPSLASPRGRPSRAPPPAGLRASLMPAPDCDALTGCQTRRLFSPEIPRVTCICRVGAARSGARGPFFSLEIAFTFGLQVLVRLAAPCLSSGFPWTWRWCVVVSCETGTRRLP